ncbi:MAG: ribonuclease T2 [Pseudomonadota bacterium]
MPWLARLALLFLALSLAPTLAQARDGDRPGQFDFFVLALSWSPTYCAGPKASPQQCRSRSHRFVVHGLWPQYERGYPDFCRTPAPYVPDPVITGMADLMPSKGLILHEWRKHGTCTGLSPEGYFDLVRQARAKVAIPPAFAADTPPMLTGEAIEAAFMAANPGLKDDMLAVDCTDGRLSEVRICLSRDLAFVACPEVNRRACSPRRPLAIPAP